MKLRIAEVHKFPQKPLYAVQIRRWFFFWETLSVWATRELAETEEMCERIERRGEKKK